MIRSILASLFFSLCCFSLSAQQHPLMASLRTIIAGKQATIGVAVIFDGKELMTVNNQYHYPMLSIFKFHQALAVLDYIERHGENLRTELFVKKSELRPATHSPLRDRYPAGNFTITIGDLLRYSLSQSDNIACDLLFKHIGGAAVVNRYVERLGVKDVHIELTEAEMEQSDMEPSLNWCTPSSAVLLMETFLQNDLFPRNYKLFLERALIETTTGADKLKAGLPKKQVVIGHKTGSSGRNEFGVKMADNDLAFVLLPDGRRYSVAVFIMNSRESDRENAAITARISRAIYEYFITHKDSQSDK